MQPDVRPQELLHMGIVRRLQIDYNDSSSEGGCRSIGSTAARLSARKALYTHEWQACGVMLGMLSGSRLFNPEAQRPSLKSTSILCLTEKVGNLTNRASEQPTSHGGVSKENRGR
jgi:hypothetical protein